VLHASRPQSHSHQRDFSGPLWLILITQWASSPINIHFQSRWALKGHYPSPESVCAQTWARVDLGQPGAKSKGFTSSSAVESCRSDSSGNYGWWLLYQTATLITENISPPAIMLNADFPQVFQVANQQNVTRVLYILVSFIFGIMCINSLHFTTWFHDTANSDCSTK